MREEKEEEENDSKLKRMVVFGGDLGAGKTSMCIHHMTGQPPEHYIPIKFDNHDKDYSINGKTFSVSFNDHEGGGQDWPRLRPFSYVGADCVVLCFSIGSPDAFARIQKFWFPFTKRYCPEAKLVLVGTKKDLREDQEVIKEHAENNKRLVTFEEGEELSRKIKAECYLECSTSRGEGIEEIFQRAAELSSQVLIDQHARRKILYSIKPRDRVNCSIL